MTQSIISITTPDGEAYDFLVEEPVFVVGRRGTCDLQLPSAAVSSVHAQFQISPLGSGGRVTDLGSKNGTFVDNKRLDPHQPHMLTDHTVVRIANVKIQVRGADDSSVSMSLGQSGTLSRKLLRGMLGEAIKKSRAWLAVTRGPSAGNRCFVEESADHVYIGAEGTHLEVSERPLANAPIVLELQDRSYVLIPHPLITLRVNGADVRNSRYLRTGDRITFLKSEIEFFDPLQTAIDDFDSQADSESDDFHHVSDTQSDDWAPPDPGRDPRRPTPDPWAAFDKRKLEKRYRDRLDARQREQGQSRPWTKLEIFFLSLAIVALLSGIVLLLGLLGVVSS